MEKFTSAQILAHGAANFELGRKAALKALVWFGFGYHGAMLEGDKQARDYLADMKALLEERGAVRSEQFAKAKVAKLVGSKFDALFGAELASNWASDADMVQACFNAAQASGATTVKRLQDWAEHGNPTHTDDIAAQKKKDREAEKKAEIAKRLAAVESVAIDMDFDAKPEPVAKPETDVVIDAEPVQNLDLSQVAKPETDVVIDAEPVQNLDLSQMDEIEFEQLVAAVAAEQARRDAERLDQVVNG